MRGWLRFWNEVGAREFDLTWVRFVLNGVEQTRSLDWRRSR
jgi:hypothetical protein